MPLPHLSPTGRDNVTHSLKWHQFMHSVSLRLKKRRRSAVPGAVPRDAITFLLRTATKKPGRRPAYRSMNEGRQSRDCNSSERLMRSASSVQATPDSRYALTAASPKRADRLSATTGAKAAPNSQAKSAVKAAPV